jgi:hypothetical protein
MNWINNENDQIKQLMKKQDIHTLAELSRLSGVGKRALYYINKESYNPTTACDEWRPTALKLSKFFNVEPEVLFGHLVVANRENKKRDMTGSEMTKQWMSDNPEKYEAYKQRAREKKIKQQDESILALQSAKYKTPIASIRAFCNSCPLGLSRNGYDQAPVTCFNTVCPLYAFRNGDPKRIALGRKCNTISVVHAK